MDPVGLSGQLPVINSLPPGDGAAFGNESKDLELEAKLERLRAQSIANDSSRDDNASKQRYAKGLLWVIVGWLAGVFLVVVFTGFRLMTLSDKVLLALIGSTTANLFSLLYIVVSHLFPKTKN